MGLWDILVPTEPGVLHNLIANPSFEYDNNELDIARLRQPSGGSNVAEIISLRTLPANTGIAYWNSIKGSGVSRSSAWASRGSYSLKINAGASTNSGVVYDPRLSSLSMSGVTVTVTEEAVSPVAWNKIPLGRQFHIAVFGLTDTGMGLANGISDSQFYLNPERDDIVAYPTMDAKRGHTAPVFASLNGNTSGNTSIKVEIAGGQDITQKGTIRGWAVWYSMDTDTTKTYILASIVPSSASTALNTTVYIHTAMNRINALNPASPSIASGKIYMYPFAVDGEYIIKGVDTKFLEECPAGIDLYVDTPSGDKQFLGRVDSEGTTSTTGNNKITVSAGATTVTVSGTPSPSFLVGRALYNSSGTFIGYVASANDLNSTVTLTAGATVSVNGVYRYSIATQTQIRLQQPATTTPIGSVFYRMSSTNVQSYPDNPIGAISSFQYNSSGTPTSTPSSILVDCTTPYFGVTNNSFANNTYKHHLYLDWYLSSPNSTNPNASYTDTGAQWKVSLVNIVSDAVPVTIVSQINIGSLSVNVTNASGIAIGDSIYTANNEFIADISNIQGTTLAFQSGARYAVSAGVGQPVQIKRLPIAAGTVIGTLDSSTATQLNAKRMGLRTKFLVTPPAGNTSRMQLRIQYTGTTSDADLFIDGVQFVDSGMVWRSYDYYNSTLSTYVNPPQFDDWNWDDVEFSYVDGDTPGAIWSDTMPTQSGTYSATFPYFTHDGAWHADFDEYDVLQSAHGMGTPRFRQQYQWRNEAKAVYGVSVPGLSQSSLLTQTFTTGFWVPLDTDNINVVVEPTISGTGMPEISTTALEYGITDGGFVQRQVARMRNMQFNVTISAKSWVGLHANRRSLINLLKFDQLSQQGERMLRYTGADTPVITRITYVGGLEYSGVQTQSFTEVLGLRFLSADPYFYTETPFTQDISPTSTTNESAMVFYKLGNTSEWTPLNFRSNEMVIRSDIANQNSESYPQLQSKNVFWDINFDPSIPKAIGWLQSPSGNVSTLVVGGEFSYPFSTIAFFYVSGFAPDTKSPTNQVDFNTGVGAISVTSGQKSVTGNGTNFTASNVGKFLFVGGDYVGKIESVQSTTACLLEENSPTTYTLQSFQFVTISNANIDTTPTQVYGRQLFQMTGGSASSNASIDAIYQESANSILVVGNFYQIIDMGDRSPNTNRNTTDDLVSLGRVSTTVKFGNQSLATQYPYFRIARFVMNDNGRVVAYPVDSQFVYDSVSNTFRSELFNQIGDQKLRAIAQAPSGYTFVGGDINTSVQPLDNTLTNNFAPYPAYRGPNATARSASQSNVYTVNPNIVTQNNIDSLEFAGFVGYRLGISRFATITTYPQSQTSSQVVQINSLGVSDTARFYTADVGKVIFTDTGIYVGQIVSIMGNAPSSRFAILAQPALIQVTQSGFILLANIKSLTTDKKINGANVYAVVDSETEPRLDYRASMWSYIPSPKQIGKMSFVSGSTSVALVGSTFTASLGISNTGRIQCSINSDVVNGDGTNFTPELVGNILTTSNGTYIGRVKSVTTTTQLVLTRKAFTNAGVEITTTLRNKYTGQVLVTKDSAGRPTRILNGTKGTTANKFSAIGATTPAKYFYLYYPKVSRGVRLGIIQSYNDTPTPKTVTLTTSASALVDTTLTSQGSEYTDWIVTPVTEDLYVPFKVVTSKIFTDSEGYILRAGQLYSIIEENSAQPASVARLRTPSTFTSSTTQYPGINYNAYSMYTANASNTAVVNFESLDETTLLNSIIRRQFDAQSSVKATAYDPVLSTDATTANSDVFASYSFGSIQPILPPSSGNLTIDDTSILNSSGTASLNVGTNQAVYVLISGRIFFIGITVNGTTLTSNNYGNVVNVPYYVIDVSGASSIKPNSNNAKLVLGYGTLKDNGTSPQCSGTAFSGYDIGRSIYIFDNNKYNFLGIIKAVSGISNITITDPQYSGFGYVPYYLSGGSPVSNNENVTWYPYQFGFSQGGTSEYKYLSNTAFGAESGSSSITSNGSQIVIPLNNQARNVSFPLNLKSDTYDLYAYFSGQLPPNASTFERPNVTGQWYYVGAVLGTSATTVTATVFSNVVNQIATTISITQNTKNVTLSGGSISAYQLIGCRLFTSSGVLIGDVISASSDTELMLSDNYTGGTLSAQNFVYTYFLSYRFDGDIGTPLCIVRRTRIQTNVPAEYAINDELYAYSSSNTSTLQYLGTIQKVIGTTSTSVDVSYMPYWATPNVIDSSNTYTTGDETGNIRGSSTILKASKSLKASIFANYFADVASTINQVVPNPYNSLQTATVNLGTATDTFDMVIPKITQVEPITGVHVSNNANTNLFTLGDDSSTTVNNTISVSGTGNSYTVSGTVGTITNKAIFRYDGVYMGVANGSGAFLSGLGPFAHTSGTAMPFSYMDYTAGTIGAVSVGSTSVVYTQGSGVPVTTLAGKALFAANGSSAGFFIGIVNYVFNDGSVDRLVFVSGALSSIPSGTSIAYANASKLNTITASTSSTSVTVTGGAYTYPSSQESLLNKAIYRTSDVVAGSAGDNPRYMHIGFVTSVTQTTSTNTATLNANARQGANNLTFIHTPYTTAGTYLNTTTLTTAGNTISCTLNSTTVTVAGTPNAFGLRGFALYTSAGDFIGVVRDSSSATVANLVSPALQTVSPASVYRYANANTATFGGGFAESNVAIFNNFGNFVGIRRGNSAFTYQLPRLVYSAASTFSWARTTRTIVTTSNSFTTSASDRSFTTNFSSPSTLIGADIFNSVNAYVGTVQSVSPNLLTAFTPITAATHTNFSYGTNSVGIVSTSTSSNIVTTVGSGIALTTFIGHAIFTTGKPLLASAVNEDYGYVFIGIVKDVGTNQLILSENAKITLDYSTIPMGNVIIYMPATIPMQIRSSVEQQSDYLNRITATSGSNVVTVYGQPDAYVLAGNQSQLYTSSNPSVYIGKASSATSPNTLILTANANVTYSGTYKYNSLNPISPLATLTNAPTSALITPSTNLSTAFWKSNGDYMGISGSATSTSDVFNFSHMPYYTTSLTNDVNIISQNEYFIWATASSSYHNNGNNTYHYLTYGVGETLTIGLSATVGTVSNGFGASLIGSALYTIGGYVGKVISANGNNITLQEPAKIASSNESFYYAPNPHLIVFNGSPSASNNEGRFIRPVNGSGIGVIDSSIGSTGIIQSPSPVNVVSGQSSVSGDSAPSRYTYTNPRLKYDLIPGDVIRTWDGNNNNAYSYSPANPSTIIGQFLGYNQLGAPNQISTVRTSAIGYNNQRIRVHRKHSLSRFVGLLQGNIIQKVTIGGQGGAYAYIYGTNTRFTSIPFDYINRDNPTGTGFYVKNASQSTWSLVGTIFQIASDSLLIIKLSANTIVDFANTSYDGGYSVQFVTGLGIVNVKSSGIMSSASTATIFDEQLYPGCAISLFNPTTLSSAGQYRVIDIISNATAVLANFDGSPYSGGAQSGMLFNVIYLYDEYPLVDTGLSTSVNEDWQPMGLTDGAVYDITTTQNGSIIASGNFTNWIDSSYIGTDANYETVKRNVGRVAKITPLIAGGKVFDAYATPIVGSSYTQNGFNDAVNVVRDITDVNPVNGYVGSGDKLMIGGAFTRTLNGELISHSLAYAEGSTISGNLQTIVSADLILSRNVDLFNATKSSTIAIASTNRLRKYSTNPITNVLDGISGSNLAIIHRGYDGVEYNTNSISTKMQYFSLRVRGNASVYPIIRIRNGSSNRTIYELHQTETGARVRFENSGLRVLAYEEITINFLPGQRSITSNIRGNMISFVSPTSNFVDWILLGANNSAGKYTQSYDDYRINVIGIHAQSNMNITISYIPRFWSFDANNMFFGTTKAGL